MWWEGAWVGRGWGYMGWMHGVDELLVREGEGGTDRGGRTHMLPLPVSSNPIHTASTTELQAVNELEPEAKRARIQQLTLAATVRPGAASGSYPGESHHNLGAAAAAAALAACLPPAPAAPVAAVSSL